MNSFEITLSLLRSSLWGEEVPSLKLSPGWWEEVYETARAQGVHTLVADAFCEDCVPPKALLARWVLDVERSETAFERVVKVGEKLSGCWNEAGIRYAILKGASIAKMYPKPEHRMSGDIDFYFPDREGRKKSFAIAKKLGDTGLDSDGDIHYRYKGIVVEHHRRWNHLSSWSAANIKAQLEGNALNPEDTLLMLSSHILRHAMVGGAGLRQLTDLAVASRFYDGKYDKDALRFRIEKLGLKRWGRLLSSVLSYSFGVPKDELPFEPDGKYRAAFLKLVRHDGNLGIKKGNSFSWHLRRFALFMAVAPGEYFARYISLALGRTRRVLGIGWK